MKTHNLKIWPSFFHAVENGLKTFEVRFNDRGFECGDTLLLKEWDPADKQYTGNEIAARVTYMLDEPCFGLEHGWCVMSISAGPLTVDNDTKPSG